MYAAALKHCRWHMYGATEYHMLNEKYNHKNQRREEIDDCFLSPRF